MVDVMLVARKGYTGTAKPQSLSWVTFPRLGIFSFSNVSAEDNTPQQSRAEQHTKQTGSWSVKHSSI